MARILLLLPTTTYRATDFIEAAQRLGVDVTVASEEKNVLESQNPEGYLKLNFENLGSVQRSVLEFSKRNPLDAVLGMDDTTVLAAAAISHALSLRSNSVESVKSARNKRLMRESFFRDGLPIPNFQAFSINENPERVASKIRYPCVLKPTLLSASQGVMRVNEPNALFDSWERLRKIIQARKTSSEVLVEDFISGQEVALEGLLEGGQLRVLAVFDKPDPLKGPFFEETIYVRPSRLASRMQEEVIACTARATKALGLETGPVHAELRMNQEGPWIIEIAARPIGGRCSRALRFGLGISLEELIIRQALGFETCSLHVDPTPSGVMMIPVPQPGILKKISGVEEAKAVPGVVDILFTTHIGQQLVPLPEGSSYIGFIFCREQTPHIVEERLRVAHNKLKFEVESTGNNLPDRVLECCHETT